MTNGQLPAGTFYEAHGQKLFVAEQGSGPGTPLVFLHGGGPGASGLTDYWPVLPFFEDRRVVLPDMLLWGQSSMTATQEPIWSYHAKHLIPVLDQIGVQKADFVCSSQGGAAALAMAATYPERVNRLVISGSEPAMNTPIAKPFMPGEGKAWVSDYYAGEGPTWDKCKELMGALEWYATTDIPDKTVEMRLVHSLLPANLESAATPNSRGTREDLTEKLKTITAPVLFLWGKYDPFASPEYAVHLSRLVQNSDVYVMDKTSHHMFEEYPEDYSRIVRAFLDRKGFA